MPRPVVARASGPSRVPLSLLVRCLVPLLALVMLVSCGGAGGGEGARPTFSPTRTATRSPATPQPSVTRSPERSRSPVIGPSDTAGAGGGAGNGTDTATTQAAPSPTASASQVTGQGQATQAESTPPTWVWWLLAALLLGAAVAIPLLMRGRRRGAWREELAEAEGELGWFAGELLPELRRADSRDQVAGGWAVGSARVAEAEDRLTVLHSTAPDDAGRERARALRDAARLARERMEQLVAPGPHDTWALDLDGIMADLETALGWPSAGHA